MTHALLALAAILVLQISPPTAPRSSDPAGPLGVVAAFENDYVRAHYVLFEPAPRRRKSDPDPPLVLYVSVDRPPGIGRRLEVPGPSKDARPSWRPGVMARGIHLELLKPVPPVSDLGEPGTDLPPGASQPEEWEGGQFVLATFRPLDFGVGAGRFPSVTTFLSDGIVEVWNRRETRRRMGVQAGDTFWFEAGTRITVIDDYPIGTAIVQLRPGR
jgi:hypothetical protein